MARLRMQVDTAERQARQDSKIVQLEREIKAVEKQMKERATLLNKLLMMQAQENQGHTNRLLDKYGHQSFTMESELERLYGKDIARNYTRSPHLQPHVLQQVLDYRTKEFTQKKQEKSEQIKYLMKERVRLQEAREKLKEKRRALERIPSPVESVISEMDLSLSLGPSPSPIGHSTHSIGAYTGRVAADLPQALDRIWHLRQDMQETYRKKRPYHGELGLKSYKPWQIDDYILIRKIVEDFVDDFINKHIHPGYSHLEPRIRGAMQKGDQEEYARTVGVLSERRPIQLVGEELFLEVTHSMIRDVAEHILSLYNFFKKSTERMLLTETEQISSSNQDDGKLEDPSYSHRAREFRAMTLKRDEKPEVWRHSLSLQSLAKRPA